MVVSWNIKDQNNFTISYIKWERNVLVVCEFLLGSCHFGFYHSWLYGLLSIEYWDLRWDTSQTSYSAQLHCKGLGSGHKNKRHKERLTHYRSCTGGWKLSHNIDYFFRHLTSHLSFNLYSLPHEREWGPQVWGHPPFYHTLQKQKPHVKFTNSIPTRDQKLNEPTSHLIMAQCHYPLW